MTRIPVDTAGCHESPGFSLPFSHFQTDNGYEGLMGHLQKGLISVTLVKCEAQSGGGSDPGQFLMKVNHSIIFALDHDAYIFVI